MIFPSKYIHYYHSAVNHLLILCRTGGLYTPRVIPYGFHMDWVDSTPQSMDSIWTIFWLGPQPFCQSIPSMDSIWTVHGMVHSMDRSMESPYGFHGISNEFQLQIHVLFHMESMHQSMHQSTWNSPYGFHGLFHMESLEI